MEIKIIVHEENEGYWAEVPSLPGCVSQGDTMEELMENIQEAIRLCLDTDVDLLASKSDNGKVFTITI